MWGFLKKRRKRRVLSSTVTKHYIEHKEESRVLAHARLAVINQHYNFTWKRVAIKNQRRCWGSCSSLKNLNFNYKILFLPPHLCDYIIVHELCHLVELNHGKKFWDLVAEQVPDYLSCVAELSAIDKGGHSIERLLKIQAAYISGEIIRQTKSELITKEIPDSWCESCGQKTVCNCRSV